MSADDAGAFWTWSLSRYARPGVEETLLALQDAHGLNVNVLLWACWCGERFAPISDTAMTEALEALAAWSRRVTAPLRDARRYLKGKTGTALEDSVRAAIKKSELAAESVEQARLGSLAQARLSPAAADNGVDAQRRAAANLQAYARLHGLQGDDDAARALLRALADRIFAEAPAGAGREG